MKKLLTWFIQKIKEPPLSPSPSVSSLSEQQQIFHRCIEKYLLLKKKPLSEFNLEAYYPLPLGRFYKLQVVLDQWILRTRKEERVASEHIAIGVDTVTLDAFFYTEKGCYGDLEELFPKFVNSVIEFCQVMIEYEDEVFGARAFNRNNAYWLVNKLIEAADLF